MLDLVSFNHQPPLNDFEQRRFVLYHEIILLQQHDQVVGVELREIRRIADSLDVESQEVFQLVRQLLVDVEWERVLQPRDEEASAAGNRDAARHELSAENNQVFDLKRSKSTSS